MRYIFVLFFLLPIISFSQIKNSEKIDSTDYYIDLVKFNQKKNNYRNCLIYSQKALEGSGSGGACSSFAQSGVDTAVRAGITNGTGSTASVFSSTEIYIPNYTGSNQKSVSIETVTETNANTIYANLIAYLVASTAAITDLTFITESSATSFVQYSSASLYGIKSS
jgi:hypothetical protein